MATVQRWLHCGFSEDSSPLNWADYLGGSSRWINLAQSLELGRVVVALHARQCIYKSIQISPSQLTILLPFHGAGVGSQRRKSKFGYQQIKTDS